MAHPEFGERLGFARWIVHLVTGVAPGHAEIGRAVGRTGPAVSAWGAESEPPIDYRVHRPLAEYLGVEYEWLILGAGEPPHPELWKVWLAARRRGTSRSAPVATGYTKLSSAEKSAKKRGA